MLKRTRSKQNNEFRVAEWEHLHGFYPYTQAAQDAPHSPYWLWKEDAKKTHVNKMNKIQRKKNNGKILQ